MDVLQENLRYEMIIGWDFFSELQIYLCFPDYIIRGNGGVYEGCTTSMRDTNNSFVGIPYDLLDNASFRDK